MSVFGYIPRSGNARSYGSCFLFLDPILFSTVAAWIYIPTSSVWEFPFLHLLTSICYLCSFWWLLYWQIWGNILWFWFTVLWRLMMLSIFSCAHWLFVYLFWRNVYLLICLLPIFKLSCLVFWCFCMSYLHSLDINPLLVMLLANIFSYL